MSIPAGYGADLPIVRQWSALLGIGLLSCLTALQVQAQSWKHVGQYSLASGEARVLLIHQVGPDLIVRVRRPDGSAEIQDSHDNRFGTEVVLLENDDLLVRSYQVDVLPRYSDMAPTYRLEELRRPGARERDLAQRLQEAARLAYRDDTPASLALMHTVFRDTPRDSPLYEVTLTQHIQALLQVADYTSALQVVDGIEAQDLLSTDVQLYLDWIQAAAAWQLRDIDLALTRFSDLDARLREYPEIPGPGAYLDRENIRAQWGATIVIAGLREGDEARMREGARLIDEALANISGHEDYRLLGELHNYVSGYSNMIYNRIDEDGRKALDLAEFFYARAGDLRSLAAIQNNKAFTLLGEGHIGQAQVLYREALRLMQQTGGYYPAAFYQSRLATTYLYTGDYDRAEYLLRDANERLHALGFDRIAITGRIDLGISYRLQGRHREAASLLEALLVDIGDDQWVEESLRIHTELARAYLILGDLAEVRKHQQQASALSTRVNRLDFRLDNLSLDAGLLLAEDRPGEVIALLEPVLANLGDATREVSQQLVLFDLLAASYFAAGRPGEALDTGRRALELISGIRSELDIATQGPAFAASTDTIISRHLEHLFARYETERERKYLDEAFQYIQQSRGMSLRQNRALRLQTARSEQIAATTELAELWAAMNAANQALLAASIEGLPLKPLEDALLASQEAYRLHESSVTPSALMHLPETVTLAAVQQALPDDAVALSFHLGQTDSWRLTITRDAIAVTRLPSFSMLESGIQALLAEMDGNAGFDAEAHKALSRLLLPDVGDTRRATLLIETMGPLSKLPWSALPLPDATGYRAAGDHFSTVQTISLSAYFAEPPPRFVRPNPTPAPAIAVFADPVFQAAAVEDRRLGGWLEALNPLPYTRLEADAIRTRYAQRNPRIFTGREASISNLLSPASRNADVLHIATHGFADTQNSFLNGLAFSAESRNPSGLLTVEEIARHTFRNRLVVISGCETGGGQMLAGEGVMSLARAFLAQGADAVVATLWPISDRATAAFMSHFYASLADDDDVPTALQAAQLALREDPRYAHPFYWGGFVLTVAEGGNP